MRRSTRARDAARRAADYLRSRQSPNGGFCFYRWGGIEEPSLADTWHAIAGFALLGIEVPRRDAVTAFLQAFKPAGVDGLYHVTQALMTLRTAAAPGPKLSERVGALDATAVLADAHVLLSARLERALRIVIMRESMALPRCAAAIADGVLALRSGDGWGEKPNLGDTCRALTTLDLCGIHAFADATRDFVDGLQVASFGFTATQDSTLANLAIACAGIRACGLLGLPLRHRDDVVDYVLACQSPAGGFARTPDALPDIASTHRGVLALTAAGALPGHRT